MRGFTMGSGVLAAGSALILTTLTPVAFTSSASAVTAPATVASTTSTAPAPRVLRQGSMGVDVLKWEKRLLVPQADRVFDGFTKRRVKQVQKWSGLRVTGRIDAATSVAIGRWNADQRAKRKASIAQQRAVARSGEGKRARIIAVAKQYRGVRYVRGGSSPRGFDCSGFTRFVMKKAIGRSLPHQSGAQRSSVKRISRSQARPGDLIFFSKGGRVYHVGIYAGGNRLYHAQRPGTRSGLGPIFSRSVSFGRVV